MSESKMALISDPSGQNLFGDTPPQRIVSLCPPVTELLFDIGLKPRIVGVSKQCRFPEAGVKTVAFAGSSKRPDLKLIADLKPDFVVVDSKETDEAVVKLLKEDYPVWDSTAATVLETIAEIRKIGSIMDKPANAGWIADKIETRFAEFQDSFVKPGQGTVKVAFLSSYTPWTAFGGHTLAGELLGYIGVENVWSDEKAVHVPDQRKIPGGSTTTILLAEGPYSFHKRHVPVVNRRFPDSKVYLVREDLLTWQGSRLLRTPAYLLELSRTLFG